MGKTRLELAGVELAQLRQSTIQIVIWSVLAALVLVVASVFVCVALVALLWDTAPLLALLGCASLYLLAGIYAVSRVKVLVRDDRPLFEATLNELARDKDALTQSIKSPAGHEAHHE